MFRFQPFALGLFILAALVASTGHTQAQSLSEKVALQAAMQRHVDEISVDGAILYLDTEAGEVRKIHPVTAHPIILSMGEHYVLCFDFRDDTGKDLHIDYFMARKANEYVVFHTAVSNHGLVANLMKSGKVKRLQ
ncbi:hypothetical protein [Nisaea sp.]|uniref:hypothetical protein n=1 Tax=Nisaea sp. TaxID=2024842 RepID=UPI003B51919F